MFFRHEQTLSVYAFSAAGRSRMAGDAAASSMQQQPPPGPPPVPVPVRRAPPPMMRHAYSFAVSSRQPGVAPVDVIVGTVEKVGGLAICRMGFERLHDPVADSAARSYSRRRVPEGIPLEIAPSHLVLSPRGRMALRDLCVTKWGQTAAEMEGTTLPYGPTPPHLRVGRPRTAPPALARRVVLNEYGVYEGPPANHACARGQSHVAAATAARRRLVLQPAYAQPQWTARRRDGRSNFEHRLDTIVQRRAAPGAWPRPPRYARGPSSPPLAGQRVQRRPFTSSEATMSFGA